MSLNTRLLAALLPASLLSTTLRHQ